MTDDTTVAQLRDELISLRAEVADLRARVGEGASASSAVDAPTDRRGFFKLAAGAAAGAVAATVVGAEPAAASTGDPVRLGQFGVPSAVTDITGIENPSGSVLNQRVFEVRNYSLTFSVGNAGLRTAVAGYSAGPDLTSGLPVGVYGSGDTGGTSTSRCIGVYGLAGRDTVGSFEPTEPVGVLGQGGGRAGIAPGVGVEGHNDQALGIGVRGRATTSSGVGMHALNTAGGIALRTEGRLVHVPSGTVGAPTGTAVKGELHRDSVGALYVCTADGSPGTWRKVVTQHPTFADAGGSINLLSKPIRLLDTRADSTAPINLGKVRPTIGVDTAAIDVTGVAVSGLQVPDGATGIIGTVTAADALGTGFLSIFPGSATFPGTSNLNFTAAAPIATGFTCALATNGTIKLRVGSAATHVIVDVAGFLF